MFSMMMVKNDKEKQEERKPNDIFWANFSVITRGQKHKPDEFGYLYNKDS